MDVRESRHQGGLPDGWKSYKSDRRNSRSGHIKSNSCTSST